MKKNPHDQMPYEFMQAANHRPSRLARHLLMLSTALASGAIALSLHWYADENFKLAGSENLGATVSFRDMNKEGDRRIQHIVKMMRESREGEQLYQFASTQDIKLKWEPSQDNAGSYGGGIVTLDPRAKNIDIIYAMAHELNHGWQDKITQGKDVLTDPETTWQTSRLREVGACAYSAHFAAQYTEQTGRTFPSYKRVFGGRTAHNYTKMGAANRDYFANAVLPCFDELNKNDKYLVNHLNHARMKLHLAQSFNSLVKIKETSARLQNIPYSAPMAPSPFTPLQRDEKAHMMGSLFTPTLDAKDIPPELAPEDTRSVLSFVEREAAPSDPIALEILNDLQAGFEILAQDTAETEDKAYARTIHFLTPKNEGLTP
jgi:hypothetical protein